MPPPRTRPRGLAAGSAALVATLLTLGSPSITPAVAQTPAGGTFSITPSRRDVAGRPPVSLAATRVTNTTAAAYDVRVIPVLLRQDLTGAFQFDERPLPLKAARMILRVAPSRLRLAPGQSRKVSLRWELLPLGARAAYVGVIFQGQGRLKGGKSVPVITRLLSTNFLRLPGRYHPNGIFSRLNAIQFAPRVLRVVPRVKNTGDIVGAPKHGRLAIHDASGATVYKTRWTGDVILPRASRDFQIEVRKVLPAGRYTASAAMSFGANRNAKVKTSFTLVGPNELPTPGVKIADFAAHGEVGRPAHVSGRVRSVGTAPAGVELKVSIFRVTGGLAQARALATKALRFSALAPASERPLAVDLAGRLTRGEYRVVAQYKDPTGVPQQLTSDFAATAHRGLVDRLRLFFNRHEVLVVLIVALIVIAGIVFGLVRRQRRLESELRDVKAQRDRDQPPT